MQANSVSMIDTTAPAADMVAPAKSSKAQGEEFGKVMDEQRQSKRPGQAETKPQRDVKQAETKPQRDVKQEKVAEKEQATEQKKNTEQQVAEKSQPAEEVVVAKKMKPQQTLVQLMKVIAGGETPELVEEFGSSEELLNQLVQQLEGADLEGEQVLAGIDLSALTEQLQALTEDGGEQKLGQLAEQLDIELEKTLADKDGLLRNTELAAAAMPNADGQQQAPPLVENLAQARQVLQQAIDTVVAQQSSANAENAEPAVAATEQNGEELLTSEDAAKEVDPRFAGLLKPRSDNRPQQSLRQQVQGDNQNKQTPVPLPAGDTTQAPAEMSAEQEVDADFARLLKEAPKQGLEKLTSKLQGQEQANPMPVQGQNAKVMPSQTPTVQLPSGQQVAESQIFDQVVTRFVGSSNGDAGRMVLRLQPAELGSLKIELQVEGDRIRANLHAQSIHVQQVLERNLPHLRNALAEQGLKIDQFQVDVDQGQNQQGQFDQLAQQNQQQQQQQQQQGQHPRQPGGWQHAWGAEESIVPLAHLMQNGGGGLSLHV